MSETESETKSYGEKLFESLPYEDKDSFKRDFLKLPEETQELVAESIRTVVKIEEEYWNGFAKFLKERDKPPQPYQATKKFLNKLGFSYEIIENKSQEYWKECKQIRARVDKEHSSLSTIDLTIGTRVSCNYLDKKINFYDNQLNHALRVVAKGTGNEDIIKKAESLGR